ncbi:MAG: DegT/DnrJ/EryC1/StrS family aminotransferase [Candidatus Yanofskybacteria bacterium]|nr:DegT/DnrJ/EryC1/StrS family aminotransferase [Candidatus Yanofskybacteria bacterium]
MSKISKPKHDRGWRFRGNELKYLSEVLDNGFASGTTGTMNIRLEEAFAKRFGMKYAITCNSGTSTLHQALLAFGVGRGDEVLLPALTVVMCAFAIIHTGARPVFVDVNPETFLIDPRDLERKITKKTKAIMPVHLYGQVCDMSAIMPLAKKYKLPVLEDCAQCVLGKDNLGRIGGTIGDVGSFSFQSTKHLATGDGGMLISNDEGLAERMRKFGGLGFKHLRADRRLVKKNRDLFQDPQYLRHDLIGFNYRLSELGAAVGLAQVEKINLLVAKRQQMGKKYLETIKRAECFWLIPQRVPTDYEHSYYTFAVKYNGEKERGVSWYDFRKKYMELGGDGIYAAWALVYNEPAIKYFLLENKIKQPFCPATEELQPKLMQFTTNQAKVEEMDQQVAVLTKTIKFFS